MTDERRDERAQRGDSTGRRRYERPAVKATLPFETFVLAQVGEGCVSPACVSDENGNPCNGG